MLLKIQSAALAFLSESDEDKEDPKRVDTQTEDNLFAKQEDKDDPEDREIIDFDEDSYMILMFVQVIPCVKMWRS